MKASFGLFVPCVRRVLTASRVGDMHPEGASACYLTAEGGGCPLELDVRMDAKSSGFLWMHFGKRGVDFVQIGFGISGSSHPREGC